MLRPMESDQCGVFLALCFCFFKISHGFGRKLLLFNSFYSSPSLEKSPLNLNFILFLPSFLLYYRENTLENVKHFPEQGKACDPMKLHVSNEKRNFLSGLLLVFHNSEQRHEPLCLSLIFWKTCPGDYNH